MGQACRTRRARVDHLVVRARDRVAVVGEELSFGLAAEEKPMVALSCERDGRSFRAMRQSKTRRWRHHMTLIRAVHHVFRNGVLV